MALTIASRYSPLVASTVTLLAVCSAAATALAEPALPPGFQAQVVVEDLREPVALGFAADGRAFIAEKGGRILSFPALPGVAESALVPSSPGSSVFADLSDSVQSYWDRGLLGLAVAPSYPLDRRVFVLSTRDAIPDTGGTWGDGCPDPPGATVDGCAVEQRLSVLTAGPTTDGLAIGPQRVLIDGWCAQYPTNSVGSLRFGGDGMLYASAGDGASADFADIGNGGGSPGSPTSANPCGDGHPGDRNGVAESGTGAEGGALRAQDLRTPGDPVGLSGTIIRVDPSTGLAPPTNPLAGSADANARRIVASGLRNPRRFTTRPGSPEIWVGDIGSDGWEEVNVIANPTVSAPNFGWPCEEGPFRQPAFTALGLSLCESLVGEGSIARPYFTYEHGGDVALGDVTRGASPGACDGTGDAISAIAFVPTLGTRYPAAYRGALVFGDSARGCLWFMPAGASGAPDQTRVQRLATGLGPVDLVAGPGGDLYAVDAAAGEVRRIRYVGPGQPPRATVRATPPVGPAPLRVTLDGSGSIDPDSSVLEHTWDLDDDGVFDDAVGPIVVSTLPAGAHRVHLRVTDASGLADVTTTRVVSGNTPPEAVIRAPRTELRWRAGQRITAVGLGRDGEDGPLGGAALRWSLEIRHCDRSAPTRCHLHLLDRASGATFSFAAPSHEYPSTLLLRLSATDATGVSATDTVTLQPQTAEVVYETRPAGGALTIGGRVATETTSRTEIVGATVRLTAARITRARGVLRSFTAWSDDVGTAARAIVVPEGGGRYSARLGNARPIARARWAPATGSVPSRVRFDASASSDPDSGDQLTFSWDLDGDGSFDDATGPTPTRTYRRTGTYHPAVRVTDLAGEASVLRTEVVVVPNGTIAGSVSRGCKWRARYYANDSLRGAPVLTRCELALPPSWGTGRPTTRVPKDGFSARWVGAYRFPGGRTRFEVSADDGVRIFIDGKKVFDRWEEGAYSRHVWVSRIRQGVHVVRVDYVERTGGAYAAVGWRPTTAPVRPVRILR